MEGKQELKGRVRDACAHFLVPADAGETFRELDAAIGKLHPKYQAVIGAFRQSLAAAVSTVAMPYSLANSSVVQSHFQRIHSAERIRALKMGEDDFLPGEDSETGRKRKADGEASRRMAEFLESGEGRDIVVGDVCSFLLKRLKHGLEPTARELLRQGLVLLWSAFEVLFRDAFEMVLNEHPEKVRVLASDPATHRRFEADPLPLDTLVEYGFNLSARLGTVLVAQRDFRDLPTIKAVFGVLFPDSSDLRQALAERELWTLYQRRHLMVHRGGVIDQAYRDGTGETQAVGTSLVVVPDNFESALKAVVSAGTALARSLS